MLMFSYISFSILQKPFNRRLLIAPAHNTTILWAHARTGTSEAGCQRPRLKHDQWLLHIIIVNFVHIIPFTALSSAHLLSSIVSFKTSAGILFLTLIIFGQQLLLNK